MDSSTAYSIRAAILWSYWMLDALHKSVPLFGLLCIAAVGCGPQFGLPRLCDPQSESAKLAEAKRFDPYPDPTVGGNMLGARPRGFQDPRPEPDLLAKEQMVVPNHGAVVGPPPGSVPGAPAVVLPATPSYPPGSVAPPPGAVMPPAGTAVPAGPTPQVVYPQSSATYPPAGTWTAQPTPQVVGAASGNMTPVGAGFTPNMSAAPAAYGKALSSP